MRFRSKVVEISAVRFVAVSENGKAEFDFGSGECPHWLLHAFAQEVLKADRRGPCLWVKTLEGTMCCSAGDWVICGTEGELYPCKPSVFERKYEPVWGSPS